MRQWVLSVPKRLRWYLEREPTAVTAVRHPFLRVVEAHLRERSPGASPRARLGAVSFVHRFGASLHRHLHCHGGILDGVFEPLEAGGVQCRQALALAAAKTPVSPAAAATKARSSAHDPWAMLIARLFLALLLVCPRCGADRRIVAFITKAAPVQRILNHIGEPAEPPRIAPARGPPAWDDPPVDAIPDWEALAQPSPEHAFDQEVPW